VRGIVGPISPISLTWINDTPHEPLARSCWRSSCRTGQHRLVDYRVEFIIEKALFCVPTGAMSLAHLRHFRRGGAVGPLAPVDERRVVTLFGELGHEDMMGR
jgi:hypothetical protein